MRFLVTGSAGHLGEALMRSLQNAGADALGVDLVDSEFTARVGSITDRSFVKECMAGVDAVLHTATLHKPHLATHSRQEFVDTNITGTLNLLEEAVAQRLRAFVFTSTTSTFGAALVPPKGAPTSWITEDVTPVPKNIYGVSKVAAEDLCALFHRNQSLPCVVLRTSRFFPEEDDNKARREAFADANAKANEFLFRRVDIEDAATAHLLAVERAGDIGFGRYIISATTPFEPSDLIALRDDAESILRARVPEYAAEYQRRGWKMFPGIDRVYVNKRAREELGWQPQYDFARVIGQLAADDAPGSDLARLVGAKGYHSQRFDCGPYPVE